MRFIPIVLLSLLSGVLMGQYDPNAYQILDAMSKRYKALTSFEASLTYTLTNQVSKVNDKFEGKIQVKGDKYRLTLPEQEIINNGAVIWTYIPEANEVTVDNAENGAEDINPSKIYDLYKKGFKYLLLPPEMDSGIKVDVIDLVPEKKDAQFFKIKMRISQKDKSIVSWEMFEKSGNRFKYTISKFTPNTKLDDSVFSWDSKKHPGVEEINLRNE